MKAIIYTGVVLMAAATVYGFADLSKDQPKAIYENKIEKPALKEKPTAAPVTTIAEKKNVITKAKQKAVKRESSEKVAEKELLPLTSEIALPIVAESVLAEENTSLKENTSGKKIEAAKKKKRVRAKMFSRAPLSEEYIEDAPKLRKSKL